MGMFGNLSHAVSSYFDGPIPWSDRLQAAGASLGGDPQTAAAIRASAIKQVLAQQKAGQQKTMLDQIAQMLGGDPVSTVDQVNAPEIGRNPAPIATRAAVPLSDPRWAKVALAAPAAGINLASLLKVQELNKPTYEEGVRLPSAYDPSNPAFIPKRSEGMAPQFRNGQLVGMGNIPGYTTAAAENAGAVKGAEAAAQAPYQAVQVTGPHGEPVTINAAALARGGGFMGPSPAAQAADVATSTAGAAANVQLPQSLADAQQARDLIQVLRNNPEGPKRTGAYSLLPAIPGTAGAAFDAEHDQLQGKMFLQAYNGLRGGGQITEVEGKKATQAIARLSRAQKWDDYKAALNDLDNVLSAGMNRAQQQPGRLQPQAAGRGGVSAIPLQDRMAEARRRGLIP